MKSVPNYLRSSGVLFAAFACLFSISLEQTAVAVIPERKQTANPQQQCPTVSVECPPSFDYDKPLRFTVTVHGPARAAIRYDWEISAGKIVAGQGTPTITVDMSGMGGQGVTASVTIQGLPNECGKQASCSIINEPPPSSAVLFDRYYPKSDLQGAVKKSRARRRAIRRR